VAIDARSLLKNMLLSLVQCGLLESTQLEYLSTIDRDAVFESELEDLRSYFAREMSGMESSASNRPPKKSREETGFLRAWQEMALLSRGGRALDMPRAAKALTEQLTLRFASSADFLDVWTADLLLALVVPVSLTSSFTSR
jgi:hypothetical protein